MRSARVSAWDFTLIKPGEEAGSEGGRVCVCVCVCVCCWEGGGEGKHSHVEDELHVLF